MHGPGSVLVSEIDLSSPLNYGTPSSLGSSTFRTPGANRGTPIRIRSDIQSERKLRQVNVGGSNQPAGSSQGGDGAPGGSELGVPNSAADAVPPSEGNVLIGLFLIYFTFVCLFAII